MTTLEQHIHVIDGKQVAYDANTCPFCHPQQQAPAPKTYPCVYRKGNTVVCQPSRGVMITATYWSKENVILMSVQAMQMDATGKVILDQNRKAIWNKNTARLSLVTVTELAFELGKLVNEFKQQSSVPQRG